MTCIYCNTETKHAGTILTGVDQWGGPTKEHEYRCPNCDARVYTEPYDPPYWVPGQP